MEDDKIKNFIKTTIREILNESQKQYVLTSRQHRTITFNVIGGRIKDIVNNSGVRFPWVENQSYNRSIETWCSNNGFLLNGKDCSPEEKIFGMRAKDIPVGHELRLMYPHKFSKP